MKEFIEFRHLETLAEKSAPKFLSVLEDQLRLGGIEPAIEKLRLSGICVDPYGTRKYSKLLKNRQNLISSYNKEEKESLSKLLRDARFFDLLFDSFRNLRASTGVTALSLEHQIPAFLLAGEMFLGAFAAYARGKKIDEIKKIYPFVIGFGDKDNKLVSPEKVFAEMVSLFDKVIEQLGLILKYLDFTGASFVGLNSTISAEEVITSRDHIILFDRYDVVNKAYEYWRFWGGSIVSQKETEIYFYPLVEKDFFSQRIGSIRSRIRRNKWIEEFRLVMDKIPFNSSTKQLPTTAYRLPEECLSATFCHDYFGSDDLSEEILGISLAEWIRAYTIIRQISDLFLEERKSIRPFTLQEWCIAKTKSDWIGIFAANGIDKDKAQELVSNLTFGKTARDLVDCPFIPIDGFLVVLPSLGSNIAAADAMLSNFMYKRLEVSFRGKGLENRVLQMLSQNGIGCRNIVSREGDEEYECDAVFVLEDILFLIECKAFLQPNSPRTYYEFIDKATSASVQLGRISSYFERNITVVKEQLKLADSWQPKRVHKIIVSGTLLGKSFTINDCYITDKSILNVFLIGKLLV